MCLHPCGDSDKEFRTEGKARAKNLMFFISVIFEATRGGKTLH
jgi:hypothetical protein